MEKHLFSRKLLRAYIYAIAFTWGCLSPNLGFGTKNGISLSNRFTSTFTISISPNIVYAEYFIDDDPGFGKGVSIPITAGASIEHTFSVTMPSTLSNGLHLITVRYKDASGNWSISSPRSFIKESLISTSTSPNISFAEYFIDDDPGFGKGTAVTLAAKSSSIEHTFSVLLPANLSDGIHVVTVRYKDDLGNWSISSPRSFLKENLISTSSLPNLVYAEYFIDDDPGFGKGTAITITANSGIEHAVTIPLASTLSDGLHTVTVRYKDALGNWSISSPRSFLKESLIGTSSLPNLVYAEYFIDDDPGFGKGTAVQITANSTIEHNLTINIPSTLSEGLHLITVRYKDALGNWSISSARAFIKESPTLGMPSPELVYAEYFIDNDPGIGKGKAISFKAGQTIQNLLFDINLNNIGLTNGQHFLQLRVKDVNNTWSTVGTKTFVLSNELVRINLNTIVMCSTGTIQIPYIVEGVFNANNQFKVELSDENGVFPTSPKVLGFLTSKVNGQIPISISDKSWIDKNKIRIVSTNPVRESDPVSLIAKPLSPSISTTKTVICQGLSSVLTANACENGVVTWTGGLTGSSITIKPTKTTSYKALCTINGCKSDSSTAVTITVTPKPATPVAKSNNAIVCLGTSAVLSATGCTGTVTWTGNLTGNSVTVTPTKTSTYKALCKVNGCQSDSSTAVTITVTPKPATPVAKSNNASVCLGTSVVLTATGCSGTVTWTGNLTGSSVTVTPSKTSTYKALCTINGCKSDSSTAVTITVTPKPTTPVAKSNNASVCLGTSAILSATGCTGTVTWTGNLTGNSVTVTPTKTSTYKALCTINGCQSDSSTAVTITVTPKPATPVAKSNNASVCLGNIAVLTATGCSGTVTWTGNLTGSSVTVTPTKTSTYKALCTINGYKSDSSTAVTITVTPKPATPVAKSNNAIVCLGTSAVLSATGCTGTVTWTGNLTGSTLTVTPTKTSTYKALCKVNGCQSDSSTAVTITVTPKPATPVAKSNNASVCLGTSVVLTATGCSGTVTWTGNLTGSSVTVTPSKTSTYKAFCTINGCKSDSSTAVTITVTPKPTIPVAKSNNSSVCLGTSAILSATGCSGTVTWTGNLTGSSVTVTPTKTSTFKALCTVNSCKSDSSTSVTVTVNPKPTQPKITVSNATICAGGSAVLSATACSGGTVTWTGGLTGASITVSPSATKSYKVICTINGCKSDSSLTTTVSVLVKPNAPTITSKATTVSSVVKQWEKTYGGNWYEYFRCIVPTQDGGYLLGGNSTSIISGDKTEDGIEGWIVKTNADGKKIWDKVYGIDIRSIVATSDGGFIIGGYSPPVMWVPSDYWIIKIDANGKKIWEKAFGGTNHEYLVKIINTSDGGFLIGGSSLSGVNGYDDYYVVKIDVNGNKQWDKFFGGNCTDYLSSIVQTSEGGYLLAGYSCSNISGDKSEDIKVAFDYWIVKIDSIGNKIWDKTFGGDGFDVSPDVVLTPDGGFLLGGSSRSNISGDKSENNRDNTGMPDFWIIKIDSKGKKIWDKTFGGSRFDELIKIMGTPDGSFLLGGSSFSGINADKSEEIQGHWLIKINANGQKIWDKTFGGIGTEGGHPYDLLLTSDGGYIFGGSSNSSNYGEQVMDYWIVKIKENKTTTTTLTATGCTGTVTWSNGAKANSITVSPSTATTYTATCTVNACVSSASNAIKVSPDAIIPNGGSAYDAARIETTTIEPKINGHKVFPNPATTELNIETDLEGESTFQLYDLLGRKVAETTFIKKTKILVGDIGRGIHSYLIQNQEIRQDGKVLLE